MLRSPKPFINTKRGPRVVLPDPLPADTAASPGGGARQLRVVSVCNVLQRWYEVRRGYIIPKRVLMSPYITDPSSYLSSSHHLWGGGCLWFGVDVKVAMGFRA